MLVLGVLMTIAGALSLVMGFIQKTSISGSLSALYGQLTGTAVDDGSTIWFIVGAILIILGIIFMISGSKKRKVQIQMPAGYQPIQPVQQAPVQPVQQAPVQPVQPAANIGAKFCASCGAPVSDGKFCPKCGKPL